PRSDKRHSFWTIQPWLTSCPRSVTSFTRARALSFCAVLLLPISTTKRQSWRSLECARTCAQSAPLIRMPTRH
ncbi:hypothetical protein HBI07_253060, partial [Parastagonospora nodorum]